MSLLLACGVALVVPPLTLFLLWCLSFSLTQVIGYLRPEHSLVEPLVQLFKDPSSSGQIFRPLVILHQLFNDRRINPRLLAFLALLFSLLLLGHFHLLSHVVTHTQNFPTPSHGRVRRNPK